MSLDYLHGLRSSFLFMWYDRRGKMRRSRSKGLRNLGGVTGLVLHQTSSNRQTDETGYDHIGTHFVILPNGATLTLYDEDQILHCSRAFNRYTVAVEFVGNFPRDNGRWWKGNASRDIPTWAQIHSGRCLVNYLQNALSITHVFAHRQAAPEVERGNCPGPHLWYNVGQWALGRGLSDGGSGFTESNGTPIPDSWRDSQYDLWQ